MLAGMNLSSLLVCEDNASAEVLSGVLKELAIKVELCREVPRASVRVEQERFDLIILDCEKQADLMALLHDSRASNVNATTLAIVAVTGQENVREMFALGVNFVLYKPVSHERAISSLRAAQGVLFRDKRRKPRAPVHAHATIDYAGVQQARATLVDLAEDGMAVNFGKKLPPTCKVYFQFHLPGQTPSVRLSGQIMWQDWNGRAGIQFLDVPQTSRKVLREWLNMNLADAPNQLAAEDVEVEHSLRPSHDISPGTGQNKGESKPADCVAAVRLNDEADNRRGETRYACQIGAEVYLQGSSVRNYCRLSDLSSGGCYLEMPAAFPTGSAVELVVRTHELKLRLRGNVKASHPGYGMSVAFYMNTKDERTGVQQLIDFVAAAAESAE